MATSSIQRLAIGAVGVSTACFAYGVIIERRWYATRFNRVSRLRVADAPRPLRIALFSDLHFRPGQEHRLNYVIDAVVRANPDVVVSGGDNLESALGIELVIETHAEIATRLPGVPLIAALGAHDRYGPAQKLNPLRYFFDDGQVHRPAGERLNVDRLIGGLRDSGWQVPVNGQGVVQSALGPVHFSVVDDPHIGLEDLDAVPDRSPSDSILSLGITHAPYTRVLEHYVALGADLLLAGHTHGGQVCVPVYGALVSNCDLPPAQARGLSSYKNTPLVVTAGLGHSTYAPFRFACRPEVRIIDVV